MGAGADAADALVAQRDARLALASAGDTPAPPTLTLVATADGQPCARCSKATAHRPAYWGEWLCPRCARLTAADLDRAGRWPEVPAVYPVDETGASGPCPRERLGDPRTGAGTRQTGDGDLAPPRAARPSRPLMRDCPDTQSEFP